MERLTELNPGLVVLSISGFGHDGPEGGRAGYDQIAQGEAGLMSMTGPDPQTPTKVGVPISDLLAGMYGAYGVVAKLHERARTGTRRAGPHLAAGQCRRGARLPGHPVDRGRRGAPKAEGPHHPSICPYGLFHSSDGVVQIAVGSEGLWARFAPAFGLPVHGPDSPATRSGSAMPKSCGPRSSRLRRLLHAGTAGQAGRDRRAQRRGEEPAAGLRVGPDPLPGSADRGRAPRARRDRAARVRLCGSSTRRATSGTASTPLRRCWASTPTRCWAGWSPTHPGQRVRDGRLTGRG